MSTQGDVVLDEQQRETLKSLADVLLPSDDRMPSASAAGVHGEYLDRVLKARPDLGPVLARVLAESAGRDPAEEVRRLKRDDPEGFLALASACAGGYYLNAEVRELIGYPGQEPSLPELGESEHDLGEDILAPVKARGEFYRATPGTAIQRS